MEKTLTRKIMENHLVDGSLLAGKEMALLIGQTLLQDATGTMAWLEFEALDIGRVRIDPAVQYVDHNLLQTDFKNVDDHRFLETAAARFGAWFSPPGNGISHQVHLERFGKPGEVLLGADSHTPTAGALGMLAIGAGGLDVALAMGGRPYRFPCPAVWGIHLTGRLSPWVSTRDIVLEMLRRHSVKGGLGRVIEYYGPGVAALSVSDRAAIANMGAELGATSSLFPSDEQTREFLASQSRIHDWTPLSADPGCEYDFHDEIDLDRLTPLIAKPSMPDQVVAVSEVEGTPCQQVIVGSSANPGYEALWICVEVLKRRPVSPEVAFHINPGSRQILANLSEQGGAAVLIENGAMIHQPGCLGCIGMGQAPGTGQVSLRTFPRNFKGRSGTPDDQVYLCSSETAVASALTGKITDPRDLKEIMPFPDKRGLPRYTIVDRVIPPVGPEAALSIQIVRGPNIQPFPDFDPLPAMIEDEVVLKVPDHITTDHILPAGNDILPLRSNIPAISGFVFKRHFPRFLENIRKRGSGIVVGGENYGQGSSREHAAIAPRYLGVWIKLAKSFARIHRANLINFGIVPLVFADPADYDRIAEGDRLRFPGLRRHVEAREQSIPVETGGRTFQVLLDANARERQAILAGNVINQNKTNPDTNR